MGLIVPDSNYLVKSASRRWRDKNKHAVFEELETLAFLAAPSKPEPKKCGRLKKVRDPEIEKLKRPRKNSQSTGTIQSGRLENSYSTSYTHNPLFSVSDAKKYA